MAASPNADDAVLERFSEVHSQVRECLSAVSDINDIVGLMSTRLETIVNPTSELKIRVFSIQPMRDLAKELGEKSHQMGIALKEALNQVSSLAPDLESGYIKCKQCGGKGEVEEDRIYRDKEFAGNFKEYIPCPVCKGAMVIPISPDFRSSILEAIRGLKRLQDIQETLPE